MPLVLPLGLLQVRYDSSFGDLPGGAVSKTVWIDGDMLTWMRRMSVDDTLELVDREDGRTYRIEIVSKPLPELSLDERTLVELIRARPMGLLHDCELSEHGREVMHEMAFKQIVRISGSHWVLCS